MKETYKILRKVISDDICDYAAAEMEIFAGIVNLHDPNSGQVNGLANTFSSYGTPCMETLSLYLQPLIEELVEKSLYPSYSYGRIYYPESELTRHFDRRSSEYTLSCCIHKDQADWLLVIEDVNTGEITEVLLEKGDVLLYQGRVHAHWRPGKFKGQKQTQIFIQYVDANGDSKDLKWDTRPMLGLPWGFVQQYVKDEIEYVKEKSKNV